MRGAALRADLFSGMQAVEAAVIGSCLPLSIGLGAQLRESNNLNTWSMFRTTGFHIESNLDITENGISSTAVLCLIWPIFHSVFFIL